MDFVVLENRHFISLNNSKNYQNTRIVKDYEIDIELSDGRIYSYDNAVSEKLKRGDILIRKPNGFVCATGIQRSYTLTLDFSNRIVPPIYHRHTITSFQSKFENPLVNRLPAIVRTENNEDFISLYRKIFSISDHNSPAKKALIMELILKINAELYHQKYRECKAEETMSDIVFSYMRKNLHKNITLTDLANLVHLEKSYFTRQFRNEIGKTPIEALIELRLEHATELVSNTNTKICDIAELCGYKTTSFFISEYKKKFGMTPELHRQYLLEQNK